MLTSINTALQRVQAKPVVSKPSFQETGDAAVTRDNFGASSRTCNSGCKRGQTKEKQCLSALRALTSSTTARLLWIVHMWSSEQSRSHNNSKRSTENSSENARSEENSKRGRQSRGCTIRGTCQKQNSAYAALISNISERHRAQDVEQFDDILRTFISETNKFENRFGAIRCEEKMLAVEKWLFESLFNFRFRGTSMSYSELLVALENILIDKVATVPTARNRKIDTSATMETGMAAQGDGENLREGGDHRIVDLALQAVNKGTRKGKGSLRKGQSWNEKGIPRWQRWQRLTLGRKEIMADGQWQERKQRSRENWQGRKQIMLVFW